jgi:uncharacterized protein (TIGR02172 family)
MSIGKRIGVGNTASVYEWEEGKVLKLFYQDYPEDAVKREYHNARIVSDLDFPTPKAYEMMMHEGRLGITYDKLEGETLQDWVIKTGDLQNCAITMAELHKLMLQNEITEVPNYKDFLKDHITDVLFTSEEKEEILQRIDKLPDGDVLCHGDFHPGNILVFEGLSYVIDFMNICHGHYLYDVARTVYLVEYTPVPANVLEREQLLHFKSLLADLYLIQMNVTRDMIQDYLTVIAIVRKSECPNE